MRAAVVLGMAVVLSGAGLQAQWSQDRSAPDRSPIGRLQSYQDCDLQKLESALVYSLGHDVPGVVEGSLREVAKIKLAQPSCSSDRIAGKVEDLVQHGATPAIRYKAYLTSIVLASPGVFEAEGVAEYQSDEQFFTALSRKLEQFALRDTQQ